MAVVHVPPSEATKVARQLLAAAEELGLPATVVATSSDGLFGFSFIVPEEIIDKMKGYPKMEGYPPDGEAKEPEPVEEPEPPKRKPGRPKKNVAPEPEPEE